MAALGIVLAADAGLVSEVQYVTHLPPSTLSPPALSPFCALTLRFVTRSMLSKLQWIFLIGNVVLYIIMIVTIAMYVTTSATTGMCAAARCCAARLPSPALQHVMWCDVMCFDGGVVAGRNPWYEASIILLAVVVLAMGLMFMIQVRADWQCCDERRECDMRVCVCVCVCDFRRFDCTRNPSSARRMCTLCCCV
jgi:hypothetical protein